MREIRAARVQTRAKLDGRTLTGYAAVWDSPTEITQWGFRFTEVVKRGAFARTLAANADILVTLNHDPHRLLGRTSSGTAKLVEDATGLRFEVTLPEHGDGQIVRELVERGDLAGASFAFTVPDGGERWTGPTYRELVDLNLFEAGPVVEPAYPATSLGLRSAAGGGAPLLSLARRALQLADAALPNPRR